MKKIFSAIDIGSSTIKIVVCELFHGKLNVLASTKCASSGIKRGMVEDDELVRENIKKALNEINSSLGIKVNKVIINVPMYESEYMVNEATIIINNSQKIITGNDMVDVLEKSIDGKIQKSRELVTIQPIKYRIDELRQDIVSPRGIRANSLYVSSMATTVPKKNIYKIISILQSLNIEVIDILYGIIGDYYEFKNKDIDKKVCGVINFGASKIEVASFKKGIIFNSNIVLTGADSIDNDLSYIYNINNKQAKKVRELFCLAHKDFASKSDIYEINNKNNITVKLNQYEVSEVVSDKIKEMLEISKKTLNDLTKKEFSYIIVSGGIVNMPGFEVLAREVFGNNVIVKPVSSIGARDNCYSQSIGMIRYFINKLSIRGKEYTMFDEEEEIGLIENRRNNSNSVFGKLFNYLFDNREE